MPDTANHNNVQVLRYRTLVEQAIAGLADTQATNPTPDAYTEGVEGLLCAVLCDVQAYTRTTPDTRNTLIAMGCAALAGGMAPHALANHYATLHRP